jgi:hypothetical protein
MRVAVSISIVVDVVMSGSDDRGDERGREPLCRHYPEVNVTGFGESVREYS